MTEKSIIGNNFKIADQGLATTSDVVFNSLALNSDLDMKINDVNNVDEIRIVNGANTATLSYGGTSNKNIDLNTIPQTTGDPNIVWKFSTGILGSPPIVNYIEFNNAVANLATKIYIDYVNNENNSTSPIIKTLDAGDNIYLSNSSGSNVKMFQITKNTIQTNWSELDVIYERETSPSNYSLDELLKITFYTNATSLQVAYDNNNTNPKILTSVAGGALNIRRGSALDTDNVLTVQNGAGTNKFEVNGNGLVRVAGNDTIQMTKGIGGDDYNYFLSHTSTYPSITSASNNIAIGDFALDNITSGNGNTVCGHLAGASITSGLWNTLYGEDAGRNLTIGKENTCIGFDSLLNGVNTGRNVAVGEAALWNNSNTDLTAGNVALGYFAGSGATSSIRTTNLGYQAKTGGSFATSMGSDANASAPYAISLGSDSINATANSCVIGGKTAVTTEIVNIRPGTTNVCDLGTSAVKFKDLYLNGTAQASQVNIFTNTTPEILLRDTDTADINAFLAQISFQNSLGADASRIVYSSGSLSLENSGNGNIVFDTSNNVVPAITDTNDLGTGMLKWKDMYMSGLANIDTGVIVGNEMEMKTDAVGGFIKVSTIGQNLTLTTDNHSLVIDDSAISVRPSNDNFASLGTSSFRFKDAYLSGNLQTNSISAASLLIVNDTFRGASIGGGTLGLEAQFIPFSYLELTQNVISPAISTGSITYQVATTGAIGTQFGVEFEIYISDNAGEDGNGVGLFWGTTTPTLLNSTTGNTTFTMFSYNPGSDNGQAQYRIASNGTVQSSTLSGFVGSLPRNTWTRVKYLVNGSTLQGFTVDMNTPVYSITTTTPPTGSETVFGLLGNANGSLDTAYRVRNLQIYTGLVNPGSPTLNVSSNTTFNNDLIVYGNVNGITPVGGLFSQTVDVNFTAVTSPDTQQMIGVGAGTLTIPANGFQIGDSFHLKCGGIKSNGNGNTIQIKLMSGAVILVDTGAISLPGLSGAPWELEADFTIRTLGGAGVASLNSNGQLTFTDAGVYEGFGFNSLNNTTFDTTVINTLTMDITQSNAGNLVSVTNLVLMKTF